MKTNFETGRNQLDRLYRNQATTARYRRYKAHLEESRESIAGHIIRNRLQWVDDNNEPLLTPESKALFTSSNDIKIIWNEFPYNFEPGVSHLCVWSKLQIESDPTSPIGDVSDSTRAIIDRYVVKNFIEHLNLDEANLIWFRNFPAIQSVTELSHIHILIKDLDQTVLDSLVGTSGLTLTEEEVTELSHE